MENFVLNLFSEQLSRFILDFNPNTINANLLSGKGSITNLRLNVDVINEFLNKPPHGTLPFVKFTEIRLSELRVEVTSYTNLKKSPIVLVIEEIHASAVEPMEYHLDPAYAQKKAKPPPPHQQQQQTSNQARQQYGLLHRILDNLSVKINRIHLTFQTLGKFKTQRKGIWTPPPVSVTLENVEWISVSEAGNPGTPESVWAHNELFVQQNRFRKEGNTSQHRSYIIYKRLSMICHVRLASEAHYEQTGKQKDVKSAALISNTQIDVHVAYIRRLRDSGVSGIDVDVLCHDMDINLDVATLSDSNDGGGSNASQSLGCDVGSFVHMMIGLLHCYYKDRSFVDPLLPDGIRNVTKQHVPIVEVQSEKGTVANTGNNKPEDDEEIGPDDFMPEISLMDDVESDSDYEEEPDEEHDEAFLEWKRRYDMQKEGATSVIAATDDTITDEPTTQIKKPPMEEREKDDTEKKEYKRKRKAVIVIASGAQKFEKVSFSLSVSRVNMNLFLPSYSSIGSTNLKTLDRHCIELLVEGLVAEFIWPKVSGEIGGHVQCSFGYVHILGLLQRLSENQDDGNSSWTAVKLFPLLKIGTRLFQGHDIFALPKHLKKGWGDNKQLDGGLDKCEEFPSMESRKTTWTWDRPRRGKRAFGLKSTISFVDEKLTTWSKTSVNHEACLGTVDIILDSVPIDNMMKVFSNQNSLIDARWLSGDWTAVICNDAIAADNFCMKDYLQPLPAIYQSRRTSSSSSSMPSSELRSITAQLGSINIRVPNPGGSISSFGMTDVICGFTEATIIVSSDLPKSFLSGRIMACENNNHNFPNDPTDFSCSLESQQASISEEESTQFRMQVSVNNFSVDSVPMHQALRRGGSNVKRLIAPTNVTLMSCLEQIGAKKQSIIVSVLLQELECNLNLRLLCGALQTLNYHACNIMMKPNGNSQIDGDIPAKDNGGDKNVTLALCFHMPDISVKCWGEDSNLQSKLLFQVEANQIELGSESMRGPIENRSVLKIAADSISVDVCSESDMLELLSIGIGKSHVIALGQTAVESCSISHAEVTSTDGGGLSIRVENHDVNGTMPSLSYAIDNKSPLAVSLSFDALEVFLKTVVNALSLPVLEQSTSISIGNSIFSSIHQLCSIFSSSQEVSDVEAYHEERARNTLMRFFLSQIILLVEVSNEKSFMLLFKDVEIASGQYDKITSLTENDTGRDLLVCKHCGSEKQTWLDAYHLIDPDTKEARATFYALKLQNTIMSVAAGNSFDIVMPQNVVHYRSPIPKGGSSKQSLIEIKSLKKIMRHSMKVGKSFSSSYYKLYSMLDATLSSDLSPTAMRLQKLIADYHEKMQAAVRHMDAEVHSLRKGIFLKERERIGALALASSTASGWVRVGEDSSFSNARLFTSATFWRYWMVLDKSVIVLYKAPGCTAPSFIIPMHEHTKLRTISMASSSNKNTVVGNHLRQRGFALFDESEGMELFFVTNNQTEYDMFVSSIGRVLNLMQTESSTKVQKDDDDASVIDISNDNNPNDLSSEAGTASQTNPAADVDPSLHEASVPEEASGSNNQLSVSEATASIDFTEDSHMEVTEEMIDIQLDDEVGSTDAGFVDSDPSQSDQIQNTQLLQSEDASTSKASTNPSLSMRERLALAKGKSKLATSKFGSTLKNAKQMTREDIKQKGSQKMTVLKQTANTKLSSAAVLGKASLIQATTAVRSSMHEQSIRTTNSSDSMDKNNPSRLEKVNKSMTSAMQRLHIDEKVTKISTAVKSVRSENQVTRQLSSEMASRRKIGIAEEHMNKPVKFDARETFTAISGHPTKVKSIVSGASLATNDQVCTTTELQKFHRSWFVDVSATGSLSGRTEASINETKDVSTKPHHQMKYKITLTDACNEVNKHSVERSIGELLVFHVTISELLAQTSLRDSRNSSSFERLQVTGSLLQHIIDGNTPSQSFSSVTDMNCEWIKIFASTLLESYLPVQVLEATAIFFELKEGGATKTFRADGSVLNSDKESCAATTETNEAFDNFARAVSNQNQSVQSYAGMVPSANDRVGSQLLDIIMTAYNEATSERDSALATLAISSVLNDHHIMQKQLAKSQSNKKPVGMRNSDDEMLALCKQLGNEIAAKTEAELEVNRLKEQLELERKIAQANEAELLEQLSKKK